MTSCARIYTPISFHLKSTTSRTLLPSTPPHAPYSPLLPLMHLTPPYSPSCNLLPLLLLMHLTPPLLSLMHITLPTPPHAPYPPTLPHAPYPPTPPHAPYSFYSPSCTLLPLIPLAPPQKKGSNGTLYTTCVYKAETRNPNNSATLTRLLT